jgi:hypothetical protein
MARLFLPFLLVPFLTFADQLKFPAVKFDFQDLGTMLVADGRWDPRDVVPANGNVITEAYHVMCDARSKRRFCWEGSAFYKLETDGATSMFASGRSYEGRDDIALWSRTLIVLTESKSPCKVVQILIDRSAKSVTKLTTRNMKGCPDQYRLSGPNSEKVTLVGEFVDQHSDTLKK